MNTIALPDDLKPCVAFHGHLCPGVVIGYCAARLGMRELAAHRAQDEELIAIVENDTCAVDAIQVLTGCTFGKGNFFFRDYGKMAFTFATRPGGRSVRLCLRPVGPVDMGELSEDQRRRRRIEYMLAADPTDLFVLQRDALVCLPSPARIRESLACGRCGELVMSTRLRALGDKNVCIPCYQNTQPRQETV